MKWIVGIGIASGIVIVALALAQRASTLAVRLPTFWYWLIQAVLVAVLLIVLGYLALGLVARLVRLVDDRQRQRDGSHRIIRVRTHDDHVVIVNPDLMHTPALQVDRTTGQVAEALPVLPPREHAAVMVAREMTRRTQAAVPSDQAYIAMVGRGGLGHLPATPAALIRDSRPPAVPKVGETPPTETPAPVPQPAATPRLLPEVVRDGHEIVLGRDATDSRLAVWDMYAEPHLGVWGKSRTGKTRWIGMNVAAQQARQQKRVVVFDPDGGVSWSSLMPWVTVFQVTPDGETAKRLAGALWAEFEARDDALRQRNASSVYHMDGTPMRPLCVHLEEFSDFRTNVGAVAPTALDEFDLVVSRLLMKGAARGIHVAIYGQVPVSLPKAVASNMTWLTFRQGLNAGNDVGYWHAHTLGKGEFYYDGGRWFGYEFDATAVKSMLMTTPVLSRYAVRQPRAVPAPTPQEREDVGREAEKRRIVIEWRRSHPQGTQAEFRRWAAENGIAISRGYVSESWEMVEEDDEHGRSETDDR
jgi:hypothetical protein